ncbi:pimeloyl-ACP methyl ester carboxylesterase [Leeuwenhoekiella aestuarii]|uniref:Pimeloyl-ACP methyl ester carboxylesterase n=1 Tax=Leeuwenhoekiella aestuarii TaxID=2249426 RepID=A0A4Q0NSY0_9FLAO|nr:alpha/beta hydrolase [Leeuwenhoekiella aestuarii]RXG14255.1 pimeloyl-ACP methyl ester carboxylesterase [Leeuwenhoekiella aestuarii]RXG19004.1 pimeloyl-ACP methyl ester carboxylesterase [Leeuwenhoekiella aestuarii]
MKPTKVQSSLFYEEFGSGDALCLLHGFLENRKMWLPFVEKLSIKNHIILVDLPGHGNSNVLPGDNTMSKMAVSLNQLFDDLGVNQVKFVGHSMGGYVALAYAALFPEKTAGICLLNSTPEADTEARKELRQHGIAVAQKNYKAMISMSVANLFSEELRGKLKEEISYTKKEALKTPLAGYVACQNGMALRSDNTLLWKQARFKKWMLLGAQDTLISAEQMLEKFDRSDVEINVLSGGHMLNIENFDAVSAFLLNF